MHVELLGTGTLQSRLTRGLKAALLEGRWPAGARLPSTRQLARELALSRNTVQAAYDQLRAEGFIAARPGSGHVVRELGLRPRRRAEPPPAVTAPPTRFAARLRALPTAPLRRGEGLRYDLQVGEPVTDPSLATAWRRALARAALYTPPGYPMAQGLPALREAICGHLGRRRGLVCDPADVHIVSGTQQAVSLAARVLLEEGDRVGLEDPHYFGTRHALQAHGARIVWLPVDPDGLVTQALPRRAPRLLCVTPSHQFPSGALLSPRRRIELLRYAQAHGTWVLEDDYDGEFRYDARPLASLRAMDAHDRVLYVGSFSKLLFPGLRLAYMVLPKALQHDFVLAKRWSDLGCPAIEQAALAGFIADGGFERHLRRAAMHLRARRTAFVRALQRHAGPHLAVQAPAAGMHLVGWLPSFDAAACERLVSLARSHGVGVVSLAACHAKPPHAQGLLLGFAALSPKQLEAAARVLGACAHEVAQQLR